MNECQFAYNSFGQLVTDYQEHDGAVNTGTTPKVQYGYANGSSNTMRPTSLTYPDGRVLTYGYGTSNGIDDAVSRICSLIDNDVSSTHLADYSFVGTSANVVVDYTQPDVKYTLADLSGTNDPDTGDIYSGWDRFGRVKDCRWYDYGHSTDTARLKYGYDRATDRLWRADLVAQSLGKNFDELYSYDGLHRLKEMQRGLLNGSNTAVISETFSQCWSLDPTSNWYRFREAATGGASTLVQSRSANTVNEITNITNSTGAAWITPAYDPVGNMTILPQQADPTKSYTVIYDAWNRLIKFVDTASSEVAQENSYDARAFRTQQQNYSSGMLVETRHFYFTSAWQSIEERSGNSPSLAGPERQQIWGRRYVDDLVLRDRNSIGTLDERLYCTQDATWNVVALVDTSGTSKERYVYSPFGVTTFLSGSLTAASAISALGSTVLFTGQQYNGTIRLYLFRRRWLDGALGRFTCRDPLEYPDGPNTYAAWFVPKLSDPFGLQRICCCCCVEEADFSEVKKLNREDSYGHSFTFNIKLTYTNNKSDEDIDCTFKWEEKTNRHPIAGVPPNKWTDIFARKPDAYTFKPWRERAKRCPGKDSLSLPDDPTASLNKAARTLYFRITVTSGEGCKCKNKSIQKVATQVLEPDGMGGIKTQDFTKTVSDEELK